MTEPEEPDEQTSAVEEHDENERGSERTCVASRRRLPVDELLRFVAAPDGELVPDIRRRLPGRGVWVEANAVAVASAIKAKAFARSLKQNVTVPADLAERIDHLLVRRALERFALANKAGSVVFGYAKAESALAKPVVAGLVHAADASPDQCRKLDRLLAGTAPIIRIFTTDELSLALGRSNVVHAALIKGGASEKFLEEAQRLMRYRLPPERLEPR